MSILLGTGDGQFADPVNYPVGRRGLTLLGVGDLDGDGNLDIIAPHFDSTYFDGTDRIAVLRGESDGTLAPVESIPAPGTVSTLITEDLDGDGDLDVAAGYWRASGIHLLTNNGDASFEHQVSVPSVFSIPDLDAADLNGDGQIDLVASNGFFEQKVSVHLNTTELPAVGPQRGDFNLDGVVNAADFRIMVENFNATYPREESFFKGDFDLNTRVDLKDFLGFRELFNSQGAIAAGSDNPALNLDTDGKLTDDDVRFLVEEILKSKPGDANLDGPVNFSDFLHLSNNFGVHDASWSQGDFDGDGEVAFGDFLLLANNFGFRTADGALADGLEDIGL